VANFAVRNGLGFEEFY
jgi:hypothetical protein